LAALAGCGGDDDQSARTASSPPTETQTQTTATSADIEDTSQKPQIEKPTGPVPRRLKREDIVKGKGAAAKPGDDLTVHYVGVTFSTGEQFDASWDGGQPVTFQLAKGQLIEGWVQGMKGMKVGGRRKLVIPPELGYGEQGSPPAIPPNETLVFVIDLKKIG
jgi:peptidylprolyl isomerase